MNNNIIFTHRPLTGISVGAKSQNGVLYIAAAFTNDGTSRNGNYRKEHNDTFSRPMARRIIAGRINDAYKTYQAGGDFLPVGQYAFELQTDVSAMEFMKEFRKLFKPDVQETDNTFHNVYSEDGQFFERARMHTSDMWTTINVLAARIIKAETVDA